MLCDVRASIKLSALLRQSVIAPSVVHSARNVLGFFDTKSKERDRAAWDSNS